MILGQWYHALKGLALGKYHTKFQLSSPKGMNVISCKRNADVKLHLNLQVNLNLTYSRTDVTSRRNTISPTPAFGRWGHKNNPCLIDRKKKKKKDAGQWLPFNIKISYIDIIWQQVLVTPPRAARTSISLLRCPCLVPAGN